MTLRTGATDTRMQRRLPEQLLALAVKIIERERAATVESYTEQIGAHKGKVTDYDALGWIREYDQFLRPARKYLGIRTRRRTGGARHDKS